MCLPSAFTDVLLERLAGHAELLPGLVGAEAAGGAEELLHGSLLLGHRSGLRMDSQDRLLWQESEPA